MTTANLPSFPKISRRSLRRARAGVPTGDLVRRFGEIAVAAPFGDSEWNRTLQEAYMVIAHARRIAATRENIAACAQAISDLDRVTPRPLTAEDQARAVLSFLANK